MIENKIQYVWLNRDGSKGACSPCLQPFNSFNDAIKYGIDNRYKKGEYYLVRVLTTSVYDSHGDILVQTITKDRIKN